MLSMCACKLAESVIKMNYVIRYTLYKTLGHVFFL